MSPNGKKYETHPCTAVPEGGKSITIACQEEKVDRVCCRIDIDFNVVVCFLHACPLRILEFLYILLVCFLLSAVIPKCTGVLTV